MNELTKKAIECYGLPCHYDRDSQSIFDKDGRMMVDVRGWGMFQYKDNGDKLQDAFGEYIAELINLHPIEKLKMADEVIDRFVNSYADKVGGIEEANRLRVEAFNKYQKLKP